MSISQSWPIYYHPTLRLRYPSALVLRAKHCQDSAWFCLAQDPKATGGEREEIKRNRHKCSHPSWRPASKERPSRRVLWPVFRKLAFAGTRRNHLVSTRPMRRLLGGFSPTLKSHLVMTRLFPRIAPAVSRRSSVGVQGWMGCRCMRSWFVHNGFNGPRPGIRRGSGLPHRATRE